MEEGIKEDNMTIRLIIGEEPIDKEAYEEIKDKYINTRETVVEIRKEYDLNNNQWKKLKNRIYEETGFVRQRAGRPEKKKQEIHVPKYYSYRKEHKDYVIQKNSQSGTQHYGVCDTEADAIAAVDYLKSISWDINCWEEKKHEWCRR